MTPARGPGEDAKHSKIADFGGPKPRVLSFATRLGKPQWEPATKAAAAGAVKRLILDCRLAAKILNNFDLLERG